jgi:predicted MFS family arabinose efflux permease
MNEPSIPSPQSPTKQLSYLGRWRALSRPARLYLLHAALLTSSLAIYGLFFNLLILALGYPREFLGTLNTVSLRVAAVTSLPLWWLVTRVGLRPALIGSAVLNAASAFMLALRPEQSIAVVAVGLGGMAAVLFQVSAPPFMMQQSDQHGRDHLFSANAAINIGLAGVGSWIGGLLPARFAGILGTGAESPLAYQATYVVAGLMLLLSLIPLLFIRESAERGEGRAERGGSTPVATRSGDEEGSWRSKLRWSVVSSRWSNLRWSVVSSRWSNLRWSVVSSRWSFVIPLLVPPFLISWGAALLIPYLNLYFKERFSVPDATLGAIFAVLGIATGAAALAGPMLSSRIGKVGTIIIGQALSIPFLLLLGWSPWLTVAVGAALMRGALFNMGSPLYDAFAMERSEPATRPIVIGLINGAYTAGYLIAPEISTTIQIEYGFEPLFVVTALFYSAAVIATFVLFGRTAMVGFPRRSERPSEQ